MKLFNQQWTNWLHKKRQSVVAAAVVEEKKLIAFYLNKKKMSKNKSHLTEDCKWVCFKYFHSYCLLKEILFFYYDDYNCCFVCCLVASQNPFQLKMYGNWLKWLIGSFLLSFRSFLLYTAHIFRIGWYRNNQKPTTWNTIADFFIFGCDFIM